MIADAPGQTPRLLLRRLVPGDAAFFQRQLNQPSWIRNIGDRGIRSRADAQAYLRDKILAGYAQHGFGMYLVERREDGAAVGLCGLVRREALPTPDLGFSLLESEWGKGYAREAATAVIGYAFGPLRIARLMAITLPGNQRSSGLLEKLGFAREGSVRLNREELLLYSLAAPTPDGDGLPRGDRVQ